MITTHNHLFYQNRGALILNEGDPISFTGIDSSCDITLESNNTDIIFHRKGIYSITVNFNYQVLSASSLNCYQLLIKNKTRQYIYSSIQGNPSLTQFALKSKNLMVNVENGDVINIILKKATHVDFVRENNSEEDNEDYSEENNEDYSDDERRKIIRPSISLVIHPLRN